jgi:hypothetical protein
MQATQSGTRLLVRFAPVPHESLAGYIIRLTEANGLASPERLYRLLQRNTPTYLNREQLVQPHIARAALCLTLRRFTIRGQ